MNQIAKLIDREVKWVQPSIWKSDSELRAGDELVATLRFRSPWGSLATGQSPDGCWTFKRVGFWQTRVTIRACESDVDVAVFQNNTWSGGGTLELPDGGQILATTNFWHTNLEFKAGADQTLIEFRARGLTGHSADVVIQPAAAQLSELPWVVMLGWYLVIMMHRDTASAAGATAAIS